MKLKTKIYLIGCVAIANLYLGSYLIQHHHLTVGIPSIIMSTLAIVIVIKTLTRL